MANIELLDVKEVAALLRLSKPSIYLKIQQRRRGCGDFPLPIGDHKQRLLWLKSDIDQWILQRAARNNPPAPQDASVPEMQPAESRRQISPETLAILEKFDCLPEYMKKKKL